MQKSWWKPFEPISRRPSAALGSHGMLEGGGAMRAKWSFGRLGAGWWGEACACEGSDARDRVLRERRWGPLLESVLRPRFQAASGGPRGGGDRRAESQPRARFLENGKEDEICVQPRAGLKPMAESVGAVWPMGYRGPPWRLQAAYLIFCCFPYLLFPYDPEQTRSPWEPPASQASSRPFLWLSWGDSQSGHILPPAGGLGFQGKLRGT